MILSDKTLRTLGPQILDPFIPQKIRGGVSYGTSHAGYDFRVADEWRRITPESIAAYKRIYGKPPVLDPNMTENEMDLLFVKTTAETYVIPPHGFVLARTVERVAVPKDVIVIALGKSTYARLGVVANMTPFEPGWAGYVTLELSNTTDLPIRIYANQGIIQGIFCRMDEAAEEEYQGKYQDQPAEVVFAKV